MLGLRSLRASCKIGAAAAARKNSTIAGTVYYRVSYHNKEGTALVCPHENVKWTYAQLWENVQKVAGGLKGIGYDQGAVIATDLTNSVSNLVLQLAVAHNSMQVLTVKSAEDLERCAAEIPVQGAIMSSGSSFLSKASFPIKSLDSAAFLKLAGEPDEGNTDRDSDLAYYNSTKVTTNREVYLYGVGTAGTLEIKPEDKVCVAASLNHPFGIGGVIAGIVRNATVYLPDMNKPELGDSTILITDKHHLPNFANQTSKLTGGVVKVGSGFDLLNEKVDVGGAKLWTLGSSETGESTFRPLYDPCVDKYYTYK